jgi:hypothetical protein
LLATDSQALTHVLAIVCRTTSGHILKKARLTRTGGDTGAVTLIQQFGSALHLSIRCQMLFLDGVYLTQRQPPVFRSSAAPSLIGHSIAYRWPSVHAPGKRCSPLRTVPPQRKRECRERASRSMRVSLCTLALASRPMRVPNSSGSRRREP